MKSATSAPPLSTDGDVSTRWISMSLSNRSAPRPMVKIGTDFARSDSSSSPIGARELSAPSLTTTRPDSGTRVELLARLLDGVGDVRLAGVEGQSRVHCRSAARLMRSGRAAR